VSLITAHVAELQASTIDGQVAAERGYVSIGIESREQLLASRFPPWAAGPDESYPLLFVPMHGPGGGVTGAQIKPAVAPIGPGGKAMKYASRRNAPNVLDVHPRNADAVRDVRTQLWITEGIKKGDALTSRGLCVVTLTGVFNWRSKLGTIGDWEDVPVKGRSIVVCFDSDARSNDQVLAAMRRLGNWLVGKGAAEVTYVIVPAMVGDAAVKGVDDYFAAGGDIGGLEAVASRTVPTNSTPADPSFTDAYLAASVADDRLEGGFLYSPGLGGWQRWDGRRWARCGPESIIEEIRKHAVEQHNEAMTAYAADTGSSRLKRKLDGWRSVLARNKLAAVEFLCRGILVCDPTDFDPDPDVLNVGNGIVDLTTGELMPHDPDRRLTKIADVRYDATATHPDWKQALEALPPDTADWFQQRIGQAVTGYMPPDDKLVLLTGTGENGKTTVMSAVCRALGDYYVLVPHKALMANSDAHTTEMMTFKGARLALMEETPEERRLNATKVKNTVGTPQITARYIRQDVTTFDATHSLFISTNYPPVVDETDHGTWRRLLRIDFPYTWLAAGKQGKPGQIVRSGDTGLRARLLESFAGQHEAVLAWAVAGARRWYSNQRQMPQEPAAVMEAVRAWRIESDQLTAYLTERVEQAEGHWITGVDLLTDFSYWIRDRGGVAWSDRTFSSRMKGNDYLYTEKRPVHVGWGTRSTPNGSGHPVSGQTVRAWINAKFKG
jgi:P4 family phage/plasmid primase-like protien